MSDYNNPNNFDKYGNPLPGHTVYDPEESTGRAPYVLLGILVLIGIIGGALYFNGTPSGSRQGTDVANAPPAASRTMTPTPSPTPGATTTPSGPASTTPAPTATPAPAGPPSTTKD